MKTRALGRSGLEVGEVGLGTWGLSGEGYGPCDAATARATLAAAADAGCTFFETSDCYALGETQQLLGELKKERGASKVFVSSRVGIDRETGGMPRRDFSAKYLTLACERSLKRLGVERLDAAVLHNPTVDTLRRGEAWMCLRAMQQQGKVGMAGVSVSTVEAGRAAVEVGAELIVLPYNLLFPTLLHQLSGEVVSGTAVVVRSPYAYGLLADGWDATRRFDDDDHRTYRWTTQDLVRRVKQREVLRALVHDEVRTLREAALRYVLANHLVSVVVPGARTPEQARQNAEAVAGPPYLPDGDLAQIGAILRDAGIE